MSLAEWSTSRSLADNSKEEPISLLIRKIGSQRLKLGKPIVILTIIPRLLKIENSVAASKRRVESSSSNASAMSANTESNVEMSRKALTRE